MTNIQNSLSQSNKQKPWPEERGSGENEIFIESVRSHSWNHRACHHRGYRRMGVDWKYYGTNEDGSYFYDTESITRPSKNLVEVWVQSAYSQKSISHWVREGGKGFQDLDFTLISLELNCVERSARYLRIVFYSKMERFLSD